MLFNEPKLLKSTSPPLNTRSSACFSALQRAEIAEIRGFATTAGYSSPVSVLFNEPKLLKSRASSIRSICPRQVSVLFNEPKLLK